MSKRYKREYLENKNIEAFDKTITKHTFKIIFLLRLIPITPFNFLNYLLGFTSINVYKFMLASSLGMIPQISILVYFGTIAKSLRQIITGDIGPNFTIEIITYLISGVFIVFIFLWIIYFAKKELANVISIEEEFEMHNNEIQIIDKIDSSDHEEKETDEITKHIDVRIQTD